MALPDNPVISPATGKLDADLLSACIHCGLCLPACPTYQATGRESESPRGRIYLLGLVEKGEIPFAGEAAEHIESCLGCLGCQTACPSGVRYEEILNQARPHLKRARPKLLRAALRFGFSHVLTNYWLLIIGAKLLRLLQQIAPKGTRRQRRQSVLSGMTSSSLINRLKAYAAFVPEVPHYKPHPRRLETKTPGSETMQLFSGCVMDVLYNQVNHASAELLVKQGCAVERNEQSCCGALAFHAGENDIARRLAKENIEKFKSTDGKIVVTSAGCGAMLKEYSHLFSPDDPWHARAEQFCQRVVDIVEVLSADRISAQEALSGRPAKIDLPAASVAYHAACHLAHAQGIHNQPKEILLGLHEKLKESGKKMTLVELKEAEHCCGSAGIYNVINTELSLEVLDRKMENIEETRAEVVVTTNPGCLLQLNAGARLTNSPVKVMHLAEFVARAYPAE
ncbi:MAG: (Fe-S)-binding protein [Candidatus Obscuribacterales bacterium]|nr:(Fe-S)-binding protein [Candidatus Obscuribacterales bacterium]